MHLTMQDRMPAKGEKLVVGSGKLSTDTVSVTPMKKPQAARPLCQRQAVGF